MQNIPDEIYKIYSHSDNNIIDMWGV